MSLDERVFSEPHLFIPERFLPKPEGRGETFTPNIVFGWGRRYAGYTTNWGCIVTDDSLLKDVPRKALCGLDSMADHGETVGNLRNLSTTRL